MTRRDCDICRVRYHRDRAYCVSSVLVVGGTGPSGVSVVNGLIERGHVVTILHRGVHEVDFLEPVEHLCIHGVRVIGY